MRKSKFSEHQIIAILKAVKAGQTDKDISGEHEISEASLPLRAATKPRSADGHM